MDSKISEEDIDWAVLVRGLILQSAMEPDITILSRKSSATISTFYLVNTLAVVVD